MATEIKIGDDLYDLLTTHNFDVEITDERGQASDPANGTVFKFDYQSTSGKNYGTVVLVAGEDNELMLFYGDNLGRGMEPEDKDEWFRFMKELKDFSTRHNFHTFSPKNINALKRTMAGMAAIKEGLFEGYYGTRKISYMGEATEARLVIRHNRIIGEDDKRYRYVESLFIETVDGERFKLPFVKLTGGRAMLEHVRQGGRPYDIRGQHITETVNEMAVLSRFRRAQQGRMFEGQTRQLVENANAYYEVMQLNLKQMATPRGYQHYFESWSPAVAGQQESLVEDLRNWFVQQTLDTRIEQALPTLAKIQMQGNAMKEAQIFENWANQIMEGTWALPDTPEAQEKLNQLMSSELIVGPDAVNATELLYDVVGDDQLYDVLSDLAKRDPRANIWDDSDVQARLAELGIQTPQSTQAEPADVAQDTAPPQQGVAEGLDPDKRARLYDLIDQYRTATDPEAYYGLDGEYGDPDEVIAMIRSEFGDKIADQLEAGADKMHYPRHDIQRSDPLGWKKPVDRITKAGKMYKQDSDYMKNTIKARYKNSGKSATEGVAEGSGPKEKQKTPYRDINSAEYRAAADKQKQQMAKDKLAEPGKKLLAKQGVAEGSDLTTMLRHAGVPVKESVLTDSTGHTLDHIMQRFSREVAEFKKGADLDQDLYDALYDYYFDDMPYGVKKARTGDPYEWVTDRLDQELGTGNYAPRLPEGDNLATFEVMSGFDAPVAEGSCNMTMEGEYCPEHGLAECAMEEGWKGELAGGTAGGVAGTLAGTAIGGPVGGLVGGALGGTGGAMIGRELTKEDGKDPMDHRGAVTDSFYESRQVDELVRIKSLLSYKSI
jgi:hypothetical protein